MKACYFIDAEAMKPGMSRPLTIADFMARFFNYLFCANEIN
jgi:hypothetical protein